MPSGKTQIKEETELMNQEQGPVLVLDPVSLVILKLNPASQKILGPEYEKKIGRSLLSCIAPEDRQALVEALRVASRCKSSVKFESQWGNLEVLISPVQLSGRESSLRVMIRLATHDQADPKLLAS